MHPSGYLNVLLVEDNPADADLVLEMLEETDGYPRRFQLVHASRVSAALALLDSDTFDAVLLDLTLPDSFGLETFRRVQAHIPSMPIVVLSGLTDEAVAAQAVRDGAQDYLIKGQIDGRLLTRAIQYAVERKRAASERMQLIEREAEARARAEAAESLLQARDEFLSVAAHELKTPLTSLQVIAQLLLRRIGRGQIGDMERLQDALKTMDEQVGRLAILVTQLLEMVRLQGGRLVLEPAHANLAELVTGVVARQRAWNTTHEVMLAAPEEAWVVVDSFRIEQVVANLLENAVKYSPAGSQIDVELRCPAGEPVELRVRDRGIGIPPEHRSRIFEQFYRAHSADHRSGMGLGLYICREVVELHGGQITAEFPEDGGSCFIVRLPAAVAVELAPAGERSGDGRASRAG